MLISFQDNTKYEVGVKRLIDYLRQRDGQEQSSIPTTIKGYKNTSGMFSSFICYNQAVNNPQENVNINQRYILHSNLKISFRFFFNTLYRISVFFFAGAKFHDFSPNWWIIFQQFFIFTILSFNHNFILADIRISLSELVDQQFKIGKFIMHNARNFVRFFILQEGAPL